MLHFSIRQIFFQLKDAASAVLAHEKSTSLVELFSVELKFDTLHDWFSYVKKPKFFELNDIKRQIYIKENPTVPSKTTCSICGFFLNLLTAGENKRWYDFIVESEHLFLRNIYSSAELEGMNIGNTGNIGNRNIGNEYRYRWFFSQDNIFYIFDIN